MKILLISFLPAIILTSSIQVHAEEEIRRRRLTIEQCQQETIWILSILLIQNLLHPVVQSVTLRASLQWLWLGILLGAVWRSLLTTLQMWMLPICYATSLVHPIVVQLLAFLSVLQLLFGWQSFPILWVGFGNPVSVSNYYLLLLL